MNAYHLAQVNVALARAEMTSEIMSGFVSRLDEINRLAENSKGFVWRLIGDGSDATSIRVFENPLLLVNLSIWEDLESLKIYAYKSAHVELIRDRDAWFHKLPEAHQALWWVAAGHNRGNEPLTPMYRAIDLGNKEVAKYLLLHGASVNVVDYWFDKALDHAVKKKGGSDIVKLILERGVDCETKRNGHAAYFYVADPESLDLVRACVRSRTGSDPDLTEAFAYATRESDKDMIKALVDRGIEMSRVAPLGGTMTTGGNYSLDMVKFLLDSGADPNALDDQGTLALNAIAFRSGPENLAIAKLLLERGANVNKRDRRGWTPIHAVAGSGQIDIAKLLIEHGANLNVLAINGYKPVSPLSIAVETNNMDMAALLVEHGAQPDMPDAQTSYTPLALAIHNGRDDVVELLLKHGASPNGSSKHDVTPLGAAVGNESIALRLIGSGADVHATDDQGATPLHWAAKSGNLTIVRKLLEKGADPYVQDHQGLTAVQWAANDEMREVLTQNGRVGDSGARTVTMVSADQVLKYASSEKKDPYVYALEQVGTADLTALLNSSGTVHVGLRDKTRLLAVLYCAIQLNRADAVAVLLEHGVDPNANLEDIRRAKDNTSPTSVLAKELEKVDVRWPLRTTPALTE